MAIMDILKVLGKIFGSKQDRDIKKLNPVVEAVNSFAEKMHAYSDEELVGMTASLRARIANGEALDSLLPEAFAVVREATHRVLGERKTVIDPLSKKQIPFMAHFDVQVVAAAVLHQGKIAEMKTGEGKTQVAVMPAYLNALSGKGVHVITVNDYLARRDSEWMGRVFSFLGLTVGCLEKTEPGSPERQQAYACDITYGTNNEFGFDYLRDNMATSADTLVQRDLNYAIIDEVDNILVDEARTPLIISGPVTKSNDEYQMLRPRIQRLVNAQTSLVQKMVSDAEELLNKEGSEYEAGKKLFIVKRGSPKNKRLSKLMKESGVAKLMKQVETDYLREQKLHELDDYLYYIIDESGHSAEMMEMGREMIGEGNAEFFVVPNLSEMLGAIDKDESLSAAEKSLKREEAHREYAERSERIHSVGQLLRAFSLFEKDVDYVVQEGQILIVDEFTGRILEGRRYSEGLHQALEAKEGVRIAGENQTLATITFQNFFKMYKKLAGMTGTALTEAQEFHDIYKLDVVAIPTNRPMVRIDYDDQIYKTQREKYNAIVKQVTEMHEAGKPVLVGTTSIEKSEVLSKLLARSGVPHQVLNAKQHAMEASIVAQAGRLGSVTIATNMAGRGTDIVLGGNFDLTARNELLKEGIDPSEITSAEMRTRFAKLYKQLQDEHDKVVSLGGLQIVGTERHESRRIDNQLRGRSGRQGDSGSSMFFLSLDDDLMRIFGSERLVGIMDRLGLKEGEVIAHPWVSGSIGNAQKRVEGRNFDIRKHLKEYDDVMNLQRTEIYGLRQRVLKGEKIHDEAMEQIAAFLEDSIYKHTSSGKYPESWALEELYVDLQAQCGVIYRIPESEMSNKTQDSLFDDIWKEVKQRYEDKEQRFGADAMRRFERGVILMVIDNLWKDHLYEMDHLKGGVQFRAFGQKNPLFEYQREGLKMFEQLRNGISREITGFLFRLEAVERKERARPMPAQEIKSGFDIFNSGAPKPSAGPVSSPARRPVALNRDSSSGRPQPVVSAPQAGRNDPCPCGSGKKYKKCHGASMS
jgi:preprotein translocase subunit SecA